MIVKYQDYKISECNKYVGLPNSSHSSCTVSLDRHLPSVAAAFWTGFPETGTVTSLYQNSESERVKSYRELVLL